MNSEMDEAFSIKELIWKCWSLAVAHAVTEEDKRVCRKVAQFLESYDVKKLSGKVHDIEDIEALP